MTTVLETMRIVDVVHDRFGGDSANAVDGHHSLDMFVVFGNLVEPLFNRLEMALECFKLFKLQMQLASPKFFDATVS